MYHDSNTPDSRTVRRSASRDRTYVVVACGLDAPAAAALVPLGTVVAHDRRTARAAASRGHAVLPARALRVVAPGSAPAALLAGALAADGRRLLAASA